MFSLEEDAAIHPPSNLVTDAVILPHETRQVFQLSTLKLHVNTHTLCFKCLCGQAIITSYRHSPMHA